MKLHPTELKVLTDERARIERRLSAINKRLADHYAHRAPRKCKPVQPPREPIVNPDVAVVRAYAREHMGDPQIFNSRRKNDRRVKMWCGLTMTQFELHQAAIARLLPHATFTAAPSPRPFTDTERRCLCVVLPHA